MHVQVVLAVAISLFICVNGLPQAEGRLGHKGQGQGGFQSDNFGVKDIQLGANPVGGGDLMPTNTLGSTIPTDAANAGGGQIASFGGGPAATLGGGPVATLGGGPAATLGGGPAATLGGGPVATLGAGPAATLGGGPAATVGGGPVATLGGGPAATVGGGPVATLGSGPVTTLGVDTSPSFATALASATG